MADQKTAVRRAYDELAADYAARRSTDLPAALADAVRRFPADASVLDAGCGGGAPVATTLARDHDVVGVDLSREQLRLARETVPDARFVQGDLTELGVAESTFDAVVAFFSLIHVPIEQQPAAFAEFARVLRDDGHLCYSTIDGTWTGSNPDWLETGVEMRWSYPPPERTAEFARDAGFELLDRRTADDELGGTGVFYLARLA